MSMGNIIRVMERISGATVRSPIAVFRCEVSEKLVAVFAATVATQALIKSKDPHLIGIYDGTMEPNQVRRELLSYIHYPK